MVFLIGFLTLVMMADCIALIFLVLIQLPKKDAGLGLAFGSGAADALFGAGSGTVLTKATKYAAGIFFVLAVGLGMLQSTYYKSGKSAFQEEYKKQTSGGGITLPPTGPAATPPPGNAATPIVPPTVKPVVTPEAATPAVTVPAVPPAANPASTNQAPPK